MKWFCWARQSLETGREKEGLRRAARLQAGCKQQGASQSHSTATPCTAQPGKNARPPSELQPLPLHKAGLQRGTGHRAHAVPSAAPKEKGCCGHSPGPLLGFNTCLQSCRAAWGHFSLPTPSCSLSVPGRGLRSPGPPPRRAQQHSTHRAGGSDRCPEPREMHSPHRGSNRSPSTGRVRGGSLLSKQRQPPLCLSSRAKEQCQGWRQG